MKIAIATDAWHPQVSGVVTKFTNSARQIRRLGHELCLITPEVSKTFPCPTYPQIRLALNPFGKTNRLLNTFKPDCIHIATEGPIGLAARAYCIARKFSFTTSYTTKFPEYIKLRFPVPLSLTYGLLRWFHSASSGVMVSTDAFKKELEEWGFSKLIVWPPGVDTDLFCPKEKSFLQDSRPIFMYVGRVAVEKSIEAFLDLDLPGSKYVVGDGPDLESLKRRYPDAKFVGAKSGQELASYYAAADVFVFPSKTDTFGLVMLEALACGVPVAAYPVRGPIDIVKQGVTGYLDEDLVDAIMKALTIDPAECREFALRCTWADSVHYFLKNLVPVRRNELFDSF